MVGELLESSFFVYGLASANGMVHYDTFANVVAEVREDCICMSCTYYYYHVL